MSVALRLKELGIDLPSTSVPLASYIPAKQVGDTLYVSGQIPVVDGRIVWQGKLGRDLTIEDGMAAARLAAVNALGAIIHAVGDLDRVKGIVKLNGYVNSADDFNNQHLVVNGASEFLVSVFGDRGRHARAAVGTNSLPMDVPVEIELVVDVGR